MALIGGYSCTASTDWPCFASVMSSENVGAVLETCLDHEVVDHVHVELTIDGVYNWGSA